MHNNCNSISFDKSKKLIHIFNIYKNKKFQ